LDTSRLLAALLCIAPLAGAQEEKPEALVTLHLASAPKDGVRVMVYGADESGMRVRRLAQRRFFRIAWDDVVERDRKRLRLRFRLDLTEQQKRGEVDGVRLHFEGGGFVDGVLERVDFDGNHWLRRGGSILSYPKDRITGKEPMLLDETEVYGIEELHERLVARYRPKTAGRHVVVAERMMKAGGFEEAAGHLREAIRLRPELRWKMKPELDECEELGRDKALSGAVRRARKLARLDHRYADARALLSRHSKSRIAIRQLDEIDALEADRLNREFHARKNLLLRRMLDDFLRTRRPGFEEARTWVTTVLGKKLRTRVQEELELGDEQVDEFLRRGGNGASHWASYHSGSFIVDPAAKHGDANRWWSIHSDVAKRSAFLRAWAAEKLELLETTRVKYRSCESCGGTGRVKHTSVHPLHTLGKGHEWRELCPRCNGCGRDRIVAYR